MTQKFNALIWIAIAVAAFAGGLWLQQSSMITPSGNASAPVSDAHHEVITWLPPGRQISAVPAKNQLNMSVMFPTDNQLWKIVFFGFTHCPDICPTTLYQLDQLHQSLSLPLQQQLQIVFVTVDPPRDTVDRMKTYLQSFDNKIIGMRAETNALENISRQLGVAYHRVDLDETNYSMDHSASLYLLNPAGQWAGIATAPHDWHALRAAMEDKLDD
ncbi:MAG: SCO family protein [Gammaproteobacteria bacterium]|nr:SCO family protein [Gammaproteobacteria bacterium]